MVEHTPGPWFAHHDETMGSHVDIYDVELVQDDQGEWCVPHGSQHIARASNVMGHILVTLANADLIAKAPETAEQRDDLLAAAQGLRASPLFVCSCNLTDGECPLCILNTAIANAERKET